VDTAGRTTLHVLCGAVAAAASGGAAGRARCTSEAVAAAAAVLLAAGADMGAKNGVLLPRQQVRSTFDTAVRRAAAGARRSYF
jgi:hypothetical protein